MTRPKKARRGRPRTGEAEVAHRIRLSADLDRAVEADAGARCLTVAEWWRRAARLALGWAESGPTATLPSGPDRSPAGQDGRLTGIPGGRSDPRTR
jgi:hypothetical protein